MAITEVRIDDRLIHGQVASLWVPNLSIERLLVVDELIPSDADRSASLRFGCPPQARLSIFEPAKAAEKLLRRIDEGIRVMIVVASPIPLEQMAEAGYVVEAVTVGNMSGRPDTTALTRTAYVDAEEAVALRRLVDRGVRIASQPTPTSRREDLTSAIRTLEGRIHP